MYCKCLFVWINTIYLMQYNIICLIWCMDMKRKILQITNMHVHTCIYNTHFIFTFIALSLLSLIQHATQLLTHMHIHLYSTRHLPNPWHLWILAHHCLESLESPLKIRRKLPCVAEYHCPIVSYCIYIYYVTTHWY